MKAELNQAHLMELGIWKELHILSSQLPDTAWRVLNNCLPHEKYLEHPGGLYEIDVSVLATHNVFQ